MKGRVIVTFDKNGISIKSWTEEDLEYLRMMRESWGDE